MASGAIPSLIVYGLDLLTPAVPARWLHPLRDRRYGVRLLLNATATIGLAFLGIGAGLGIPAPITAGMIISGAYVGDKFSPLSDTTNLAAAVARPACSITSPRWSPPPARPCCSPSFSTRSLA